MKLTFRRVVLALLLAGFAYFLSLQSEILRLRANARALRAECGIPENIDPTKTYVTAIDTGEPLYWHWKVCLPKDHAVELELDYADLPNAGASTNPMTVNSLDGSSFVDVTVRISFPAKDMIRIARHTPNGIDGVTTSYRTPGFINWSEGKYTLEDYPKQTVILEPGKPTSLLRLKARKLGGAMAGASEPAPSLQIIALDKYPYSDLDP